jgi:hypothetical protein
VALAALAVSSASLVAGSSNDAVEQVKQVIERSYVHGAFNELDPEAMEAGFHPDFAIFSPNGDQIDKYPIGAWVDSTRKRKQSADFDPAENAWAHKFASVDVTGHSAAAKIELSKDGKLVYTDYLSLLNFDGKWRIVAKVYYRHPD